MQAYESNRDTLHHMLYGDERGLYEGEHHGGRLTALHRVHADCHAVLRRLRHAPSSWNSVGVIMYIM